MYDGKWTSHDTESIPVLLKTLNEQLNLDAHKVAHELNKNINDKIPIEQQIVWEIDEIDEHISIYGESEDLLESKKKLEKQLEELSNDKTNI